jgi:hypothetical protein
MSTFVARAFAILALFCAGAIGVDAADWKPIDPAELALKAPKVQPDAHAEALLWEVRVSDEMSATVQYEPTTIFEHYLRVKIFTERGREEFGTVDIPYASRVDVRDVAARTTRRVRRGRTAPAWN